MPYPRLNRTVELGGVAPLRGQKGVAPIPHPHFFFKNLISLEFKFFNKLPIF